MLRQEAALDRSIDRKVRILLRLRKESANLPTAPPGQDDGRRMGNVEEILDSDIVSDESQGVETVEDIKLNDRSGNVIENKGSGLEDRQGGGNVIENKASYALKTGMSLKRQVVSVWQVDCRRWQVGKSRFQVSGDRERGQFYCEL
jgi:hypothetical protein